SLLNAKLAGGRVFRGTSVRVGPAGQEVVAFLLPRVGVFVGGQLVRGARYVQPGGWERLQETSGLQLIYARQVAHALQAEMDQEAIRGPVGHWPSRRAFAASDFDPANLHQGVQRALREGHTTDVLDLGAGDWLVVGDDRQGLDGSAGQAALFRLLAAKQERQIRRGAELPFSRNVHEGYAPAFIQSLKLRKQSLQVRAFRQRG